MSGVDWAARRAERKVNNHIAGAAAATALPIATHDLELARADLDAFGYCLLADALAAPELERLRQRLDEQATAEREADVAYRDGGPAQDWGSFRNAAGELRSGTFGRAGGGINQRVWMLPNKGKVFLDLLGHARMRTLVGHVLGDEYLLSSYTANIANPGGVAMGLHTDQWWMPAPTSRERAALPVGSQTRTRFDDVPDAAMLSRAACCNVIWMLDDFHERSGGTRIVPGSHRFGRQPDPKLDWDVETVAATAPAGGALVTDGRTWHGTGANVGNAARRAVLTTFCGPQFRPQENFTLGVEDAVLRGASDDLRALFGFKVWCGYGRIENPVVEFVERGATGVGELTPAARSPQHPSTQST